MDENLVGYLLKALDEGERQAVEAHLHDHADSRGRLELLRQALAPLGADADEPQPPPGLVLATLARVAAHRCQPLPEAPKPPPSQAATPARRWFRRADVLVAALLLIVIGGLAFPFVLHLRQEYQTLACKNNMREVWEGLTAYSEKNNKRFPMVEPQGARSFAGVFVPLLRDEGLLQNVTVACPAQGSQPPVITAQELDNLYQSNREKYEDVRRELAGDYAYSLGFLDGERLMGLRSDLQDADRLPILADRPLFSSGSDGVPPNSPNHGFRGQNVLYIGGHVAFCTERTVGVNGDDIYLNRKRQVSPGLDHLDTVLGVSYASPQVDRQD